jgi:hypothetical protein
VGAVDQVLCQHLRLRRPAIRREWTTLLEAEPVASPLGLPGVLSHLVDRTLDQVFARLRRIRPASDEAFPPSYDAVRAQCPCARNPLLAYFQAGERALLEALVLAQVELGRPAGPERHAEASELFQAIRRIAAREVGLFCAVCRQRNAPPSPGVGDLCHGQPAAAEAVSA